MITADAIKAAREQFRLACKLYVKRAGWKSIGQYERQLWSACLDYYRGDSDAFGFIDDFMAAIENQLTRAWNEGARSVGVDPREMEDYDLLQLQSIIQSESDHVLDLATAIDQAILSKTGNQSEDMAAFRSEFRARVDLWVSRYTETVNAAAIYFGGRQKLEWVMGATEEHCETCARLNGIVAYATEWEQSGIRPQNPPNPILECEGWRCDCSLQPTDKRKTGNALTVLLDIAASRSV